MESGKLGCLTWWIPPQLPRKLYHLHSAKMMNFMPRKWIAAASFRLIGHTHISLSHIPILNFSSLVFLSSFSTPPKALSPCLHTSAVLLSILKTRNVKCPPQPRIDLRAPGIKGVGLIRVSSTCSAKGLEGRLKR